MEISIFRNIMLSKINKLRSKQTREQPLSKNYIFICDYAILYEKLIACLTCIFRGNDRPLRIGVKLSIIVGKFFTRVLDPMQHCSVRHKTSFALRRGDIPHWQSRCACCSSNR